MLEILHGYGFVNDTLLATDQIRENLQFGNRPVYEVIRLIDDTLLFFSDHIERLAQSCRIIGKPFAVSATVIRKRIAELSAACDCHHGNLKIVYGESTPGAEPILLIAFIPHFFPTPSMYQSGVPVTLFAMERSTPNAKLIKEKPKVLQELIDVEHGYYEVLMVNSEGIITEGTRSNVFFIRNGTVLTSPVEDVLPGITRKKVLYLIESQQIPLRFERINQDQLGTIESVFLTGTSPGVLPVRSIDELTFRIDHPLLLRIMQQYRQLVHDSLAGY